MIFGVLYYPLIARLPLFHGDRHLLDNQVSANLRRAYYYEFTF